MKELPDIPLPEAKDDSPHKAQESQHEAQIEWLPSSNESKLACRVWQGSRKAPVVLYLHGIEGHSQWFGKTAYLLNKDGITIYAPDRRGSGLNLEARGHLESYKVYLADVEVILQHLYAQYADRQVVLMGNCWGAKAAAVLARSNYQPLKRALTERISGLILTCPAIHTKVDLDLRTKVEIGWSWLSGQGASRTWPIPIQPAMFTDNDIYLDYIKRDPLRLTGATASFFVETARISRLAQRSAGLIDVPVLIVQSGHDQIVDEKKVQNWYQKIKAKSKLMRVFPDAAHSIDFDGTCSFEYTSLLTDWLLSLSEISR